MKLLRKILLFLVSLLAGVLLASGIYTFVVYLEYVGNKEAIFTKLEEFSRILDRESETTTPLDAAGEEPKTASVVYDRKHKVITKYSNDKYKLVSIKEMPFFLTRGFIYIEDRKFYRHHGVNYLRIMKAVVDNIRTFGKAGGGSTISQQLAKILFTKHERSLKRKIYELFCTFELERRFSKNDILKIYLNSNYMGHGTYGIANAANFYFGKSPSELTIAEAALLVGMNRSPERFSPIRNRGNAEYILDYVMGKFVEAGYLVQPQADMEISRFWSKFDQQGAVGEQSIWKTDINKSGYLTEYVRQVLEQEFDYDKITGGGLIVETTFDLEKQALAEKILSKQLKSIRSRVKDYSVKIGKEYDTAVLSKIESSFVSMDYHNGEVYTMVGGSGYSFSNQLNRAVSSYRQIGSSVKPFVYAKALDLGELQGIGIQPFTKFKDEIVTYKTGGSSYTPKNYSQQHKYGDMVSIYDALKRSLNTIAVKVMSLNEIDDVAKLIGDCANVVLPTKRIPPVLSLALGTAELSAMELAAAYCVFPRGGETVYPMVIRKISDHNGNVYYDSQRINNPYFNFLKPIKFLEEKQVMRPETAYEILQMMQAVFEPGGTGHWAARINGLRKTAYGKSGTTQDYKDGWFAGVTCDEVSACWVGIDSGESLLLSGEATAAVIWTDYNAQVFSDLSKTIPVPAHMKRKKVCKDTGLIATSKCKNILDFYFRADAAFPERCYVHNGDFMIIDEEKF